MKLIVRYCQWKRIAPIINLKALLPKLSSLKCYRWFIVFCKGMIICIKTEYQHKQIHWILSKKIYRRIMRLKCPDRCIVLLYVLQWCSCSFEGANFSIQVGRTVRSIRNIIRSYALQHFGRLQGFLNRNHQASFLLRLFKSWGFISCFYLFCSYFCYELLTNNAFYTAFANYNFESLHYTFTLYL